MALTDSSVTVAQYIQTMIDNNKASLGLADVWYGDQSLIPRTPSATVEAGPKQRMVTGAPRRTEVNIATYVMLYVEKVQAVTSNDLLAGQLGEQIETIIHGDRTLGDNVIHSLVTSLEPGFATRSGTPMRATRITVESLTQVLLPS